MEFKSNGKLLITGEYFVLKGAMAFAIPLKVGQKTLIKPIEKGNILWNSFYNGEKWFHAEFNSTSLEIIDSTDSNKSHFIQNLLLEAFKLAPKLPDKFRSVEISNYLDFNPRWGLGSSSTLLTNIAAWLNINPYELLMNTTGGSGYDLACATSDKPVLYSYNPEPNARKVDFCPDFTQNIYFVYLGNKISTTESIARYMPSIERNIHLVGKINEISIKLIKTNTIEVFENLLKEHNQILSEVLQIKTVQETLFSDFQGTIKPLGAWGGDFIMAVSKKSGAFIREYFNNKGISVVFNFKELIK